MLLVSRMSFAREMGFRTSAARPINTLVAAKTAQGQPTGNGSTSAAAAEVINYRGITFDGAVDGQIGAKAGVGDFLVLEDPESGLDGLGSAGSGLEESHAHLRRADGALISQGVAHGGRGQTYETQALRWTRSFWWLWKPAPAWMKIAGVDFCFWARRITRSRAPSVPRWFWAMTEPASWLRDPMLERDS